jgi:hypothetical protein
MKSLILSRKDGRQATPIGHALALIAIVASLPAGVGLVYLLALLLRPVNNTALALLIIPLAVGSFILPGWAVFVGGSAVLRRLGSAV